MTTDPITLTVNSQIYAGWTAIKVVRGLEKCVTDFDISVSERWSGQSEPWQIPLFAACTVKIGADLVITGYVDRYEPRFEKQSHTVRVIGRSKTQDIADCMPEIDGGHFIGYTLDAIARAVCKPFGIDVVVQCPMGAAFTGDDGMYEKTETAFAFLDRLCRLRSVLACDDERGNLVLCQAGTASAAGALVQGKNIVTAGAELRGDKRYSKYIVRAQAGLSFDNANTEPEVLGSALDPSVPRYRPFAEMAESAVDRVRAALRARWRATRNAGRGTRAPITVAGFRQADGSLWQINQLVPVTSAYLKIDRPMLIVEVAYLRDDKEGSRTQLTVAPPEGYTPDPGSVKLKTGAGTGTIWNDVKKIN